jgi:hypothetical protein
MFMKFGMNAISLHNFLHSLTHGAKPFLRSCQLCSYSRSSQRFMEPEGSLPCSQEPSTGPHSEPDQSNSYHPILSKIHFIIVHPPTSWPSQWSLSFWHSHQYPICIISYTCVLKFLPSRNTNRAIEDKSLLKIIYNIIMEVVRIAAMGEKLSFV